MLKYRLIFGTIMIMLFVGLVLFDGQLDGAITLSVDDNTVPQGTILFAMIALMVIPVQLEIGKLLKGRFVIHKSMTIPCSFLLVSGFYVSQFSDHAEIFHLYYILFAVSFTLLAAFVFQARRFGVENTVKNCSANVFVCLYPAFLSSFVIGIRTEFGLYHMLMFILVVKSSDIGAYAVGRLFGKHKFSPVISPGKTWEGLAGAVVFAAAVSVIFSNIFHIMPVVWAVVFGASFAFAGQLGDLAESMIKRDVKIKDSASTVPGFGGILDVIDSPVATAPVALFFFKLMDLFAR